MFSKILALSALLAAARAAYLGYGGAVSFQSIARHDHPVHYAAPVPRYTAPLVHYAAPVAHYATPVAHYSTPVSHYAAPVAHYATSGSNYGGQNTNARRKYNSAYNSRNNNAVHGYYSLAQSNVAPRKEYTANHMGLAAVLRNLALPLHPAPIYEEEENLY